MDASKSNVAQPMNRRIRVFVSSTFRDMVEDRNALMTHCWPQLRRFCRERQVELTEVDLRWGIAEEQSTRRETLKICLDEIRACRPFFVGLLGERYGWVPGDDAFTADLKEEQPWLKDLHGRSVTELEILHGVLNNPDMAGRAFFYFRDPAFKKGGTDYDSENAASAEKQRKLKELIRRTCEAKKIPLRENYPDPATLAALVLENLQTAIEAQFPKGSEPEPLTKEARDHEAFAESRRRTYIARPDYFEVLDRHAAGDGGPLVLTGQAGGGKSALLANWAAHWRRANPNDVLVQHYIGGTPDSAEHWRLVRRLIQEIKRWTDDPEDVPGSHDGLLRDFPGWLAKARIAAADRGVRFIIMLDALNQLDETDNARRLGWLPEHAFTGSLRLLVSTLPGDALKTCEQRGWTSLHIQPLGVDERRRMIAGHLGRFGKTLDAHRLERLAAAPAAANPLHLKILLDELRVTGTHDRLDERLDAYLSAPDIPSLLQHVLARYRRDYERDRPGLVGEALGLLRGARRGLTENELLDLLRSPDPSGRPGRSPGGQRLPLATWAPFRAALEESLVDRGGILNFAHDFMRDAVAAAFAPDGDRCDRFRRRLADYFEAEPVTARSCDELPWLLRATESRDRLRACLLDIDRFLLIHARDRDELLSAWVWLNEERTMGDRYRQCFEKWSARDITPFRLADAANELGAFLNRAALHAGAEPLLRRALAVAEQDVGAMHPILAGILTNLMDALQETGRVEEAVPVMRRILALDEERYGSVHQRIAQDLSNLGQLLVRHSPAEAEQALRRALEIQQTLGFDTDAPAVGAVMNNLAMLLLDRGRSEEAEPLMRTALAAALKTLDEGHPTVVLRLSNLAAILREGGRLPEAETAARSALAAAEHAFGPNHPQTAKCLSHVALILLKSRHLPEAEVLMLRAVGILLEVTRELGRPHERVPDILLGCAVLLEATGLDRDEIATRLCALCVRHDVDPGVIQSPLLLTQADVQRKYQALMARMNDDPERARDIYMGLRTEDPAFFQLMQARIENWQEKNAGEPP